MGRDYPNDSIAKNGLRLEETCCYSNSSEKPSANTDVKNSKGVNNNNNNNNSNMDHESDNDTRQSRGNWNRAKEPGKEAQRGKRMN